MAILLAAVLLCCTAAGCWWHVHMARRVHEPQQPSWVPPHPMGAGFPARALPPSLPGYTARAAAGISGDDLECPSSVVPGVCAFASAVDAATVCAALPECRAVTFYGQGAQRSAVRPLLACNRATSNPSLRANWPGQ